MIDSTWRSPQGYGVQPQRGHDAYDLPALPDELLWTVCELTGPAFNCHCLLIASEIVAES